MDRFLEETMNEDLVGLALLVHVVDAGSFTAAAARAGMTKSAVSKRIARLEEALGVRLLLRTTRQVTPTEAGQAVYLHAARMLAEAEEARRAMEEHASEPRGLLRVTAPVTFAEVHLAPLLPELVRRHPQLRVELHVGDALVDLVGEGFDLAVRISARLDPSLVARRLAPVRQVLAASPAYLAAHGTPRTPQDLPGHACMRYTLLRSQEEWRFDTPEGPVSFEIEPVLESNNGLMLSAAAAAGVGLAMLPDFLVVDQLRSGALVPLLTEHVPSMGHVWAVWPHRRLMSPKVRAFVDLLVEHLAGPSVTGFDTVAPN